MFNRAKKLNPANSSNYTGGVFKVSVDVDTMMRYYQFYRMPINVYVPDDTS